ncbi:porin [Thioalkalivibrio sp. ALE11]|uniref:porin n=1 Tax=Thioalkalivibrio sp. ALE11 TaxID=1265494 RepID=UPI000379178C|nr:porin [Thioalkalivibrio sp. ALE11]
MQKKILAMAVAGAFAAAPALASADDSVSLFGQFKYEVGFIDDGSDRNFVHSSRGTRLGVDVQNDLGGGLTATARFQGNFNQVNGVQGNQDWGTSENAWVGLTGDFGRLRVGRADSAVKEASKGFRNFTDTLADGGISRPYGWNRAEGIHYNSPSFGGTTIGVTVEPNGAETDAYYALNVQYDQGPIRVTAAIEDSADTGVYAAANGGPGVIGADETNYQVGGLFDFGPGNVGLLYQARNDGDDDVFTVPFNFGVTSNVNIRAAVQHVDPDVGDDWTNIAVGAQYNFNNRTEAWVNLWEDDSFDASGVQGAVGLRHSF